MSTDPFCHHRDTARVDYASLVRFAQANNVVAVCEFLRKHGEHFIAVAANAETRDAADSLVQARAREQRLTRLLSEAEEEINKLRRKRVAGGKMAIREARRLAARATRQQHGHEVTKLRAVIDRLQAKVSSMKEQVRSANLQVKKSLNARIFNFASKAPRRRAVSAGEAAKKLLGGRR